MKIEIRFLAGARAGQVMQLPAADKIRLGRHPDNDVAFDVQRDLDVSGHHAELRRQGDGYVLVDIGSSNGTFSVGHRVTQLRVASGQEISFGASGPRITIRFIDDAPTAVSGPMPAAARPAPAPHPAPAAAVGAAAPAAAPAADLSPGQAVAAAMGDRRVGQRTVAMMIDAAMVKAGERKGVGGKSTVFLRSMVSQAVTQSTRRFKVVTVLLVALLLGAIGGFLALRYVERRDVKAEQERMRQEMARLMEQQKSAGSEEKTKLAAKLEELNRKLAQSGGAGVTSGKEIVARNRKRVFLLAFDKGREANGYCTGFAVGKRLLATNAHCIIAYNDYAKQGYTMYVVMNQEPSKRFRILKVAHHPDYHRPQKTISHDVGLVSIDGDLDDLVELADEQSLRQLSAGDFMYTYGFPGRLANPLSPDATLVQGVIGRVTRLDGQLGSYEENKLIQHSAFTSGGTSGSPIFNQEGKVIAVNTGGYVEPGTMQVMDPLTGRQGNLMVAKQLAGYNFGIRIDVLRQLMEQLKE